VARGDCLLTTAERKDAMTRIRRQEKSSKRRLSEGKGRKRKEERREDERI